MFVDTEKSQASPKVTSRSSLSSLLVALLFALTTNPNKIQAPTFTDFQINVPLQFCAGAAGHPVGEHRIHMLDSWVPTALQITGGNGQTSTLFQVEETNTDSTSARSEPYLF